jgi:hypothetical protein
MHRLTWLSQLSNTIKSNTMSRRKRSSKILDKAQRRIAGLKSIDPSLNLGSGLTVAALSTLMEATRQKLEAYNTVLSTVDQSYNTMLEAEQSLAELLERMLTGVSARYGKTSNEYEMAGGVRRRSRRRTVRSIDPTATETTQAA